MAEKVCHVFDSATQVGLTQALGLSSVFHGSSNSSRNGDELMNNSISQSRGKTIALGVAIGVALGAGVGVVFGNIPLGAGVGLVIGLVFGFMLSKRKA